MSIADKLLYLNETKRQLKETIQELTGTLVEDSDEFRNYIVPIWESFLAVQLRGKQSFWYDPSDLSTLFQDAEGTIPVTESGQPVGMIRDKSGNGKHAKQVISSSRPLYQTDGKMHWIKFDGVDDFLVADSGVVGVTQASAYASFTDGTPDNYIPIFESGYSNQIGSFALYSRHSSGPAGLLNGGLSTGTRYRRNTTYHTLSFFYDTAGGAGVEQCVRGRVDGVAGLDPVLPGGVDSDGAGGGLLQEYPVYIGSRTGNSRFSDLSLFSLLVVEGIRNEESLDQYFAIKLGDLI